jgi:hypothetical protein
LDGLGPVLALHDQPTLGTPVLFGSLTLLPAPLSWITKPVLTPARTLHRPD